MSLIDDTINPDLTPDGSEGQDFGTNESTQAASESKAARKPKSQRSFTRKDVEMLTLSKNVVAKAGDIYFPSTYCTREQLAAVNAEYESALDELLQMESNRPQRSKELTALQNQMQKDVENVKHYLQEVYSFPDCVTHYSAFGIIYTNHGYKLPTNREPMRKALELMVGAIQSYGFTDRKYGLDYWQTCLTTFRSLVSNTYTSSSDKTESVIIKNNHKTLVEKVLKSVIHITQGHHPEDYMQYLRVFGFQKEKY